MKNQIIITCFILTLFACNTKKSFYGNELSVLKQTINYNEQSSLKDNNYINTQLPVPFESFRYFKVKTAKQNIKLTKLNLNAQNQRTKAFLLGCMSIDLTYCIAQNNLKLASKYLNSIKKLANELQIEDVFSTKNYQRFNENLGNKDSLISIVRGINKQIFQHFSNNGQKNVIPFTIIGGWFETFNLVQQIYANDNQKLAEIIITEEPKIVNLQNFLFEQLLSTNADYYYEDISMIIRNLQTLTQLIEKFKITQDSIEKIRTLYTFFYKANYYRNKLINAKL